jgi:hypothetical protein
VLIAQAQTKLEEEDSEQRTRGSSGYGVEANSENAEDEDSPVLCMNDHSAVPASVECVSPPNDPDHGSKECLPSAVRPESGKEEAPSVTKEKEDILAETRVTDRDAAAAQSLHATAGDVTIPAAEKRSALDEAEVRLVTGFEALGACASSCCSWPGTPRGRARRGPRRRCVTGRADVANCAGMANGGKRRLEEDADADDEEGGEDHRGKRWNKHFRRYVCMRQMSH